MHACMQSQIAASVLSVLTCTVWTHFWGSQGGSSPCQRTAPTCMHTSFCGVIIMYIKIEIITG